MIWFGNVNRLLPTRSPAFYGPLPEHSRMQRALEAVAEQAPHLDGGALLDALSETGWVDRSTAQRLLPEFRHFDPDKHFAEQLRRLSFRGRGVADTFRQRVRLILEEVTGCGAVGEVGPEVGIRFQAGAREGVVLAHPEVSFSIGGSTRDAISAAVEEMPDALVVVAKNFDAQAPAQLSGLLSRTGVPGTLVTVNLLLGIRALHHRYRPSLDRVVDLLGLGRPLRSADIARLGDRTA